MPAVVFLIALAARLWFVDQHPLDLYLVSNMAFIDARARHLLSGTSTALDAFTPVGYPTLLALVYATFREPYVIVGTIQAILGALTCSLTHAIALRAVRSHALAAAAGLAMALYLPLVVYTGFLLTETLFAFLLAVFVVLMAAPDGARVPRAAIAGLVLGAATVVRPNLLLAYPLLVLLALALRWRRSGGPRTWRALLVATVFSVPVLGAVAVHNSALTGRPTFLATNGGINFFMGHCECRAVTYPPGTGIGETSGYQNRARYTEVIASPRPATDEAYFYRRTLRLLAAEPRRRLVAAVSSLGDSLVLTDIGPWPAQPFYPGWMGHETELRAFGKGFAWLAIVPAALHLAIRGARRALGSAAPLDPLRSLLLIFVAAMLATQVIFRGDPRLRIPFDPLLLVLALEAWQAAARLVFGRRSGKGVRTLFALLLVLLAFPATARAQDAGARCSAKVEAWVADAGRAAGIPVHAVFCGAERVVLRLEPQGAAPLDVDVTHTPERAFRRSGSLGVSPILEVDDFQDVPAARREPFERLMQWVDQHQDEVTFGTGAVRPELRAEVEHVGAPPGFAWLVPAALVLAFVARPRPRRVEPGALRAALALVAVALALRLLFGAWGPFHINGQGPLWILAAAVDPAEAGAYGPGYAELFSPLVRHAPFAPDHVIFAANAALSALLPGLLFGVVRLTGVDRRRALIAGLVLALDPVSIRLAATESYVTPIAALTALASLLALAAAGAAARSPRRAACLALAAGLACAQAARIHPVAWIPVALAPLAAVAVASRPPGMRVLLALGATSIAGATVVLTSAPQLLDTYAGMLTSRTMAASWIWPHLEPAPALAAIGVLLLVARPRAPLLAGALAALALASTRHNYGQSALWQASFDRLYLVPLLAAAAALIPFPFARTRIFVPAAALVLLALFARHGTSVVQGRTTEHEEYRWARRWLSTLPPSCRVVYVGVAGIRTLFLPTYVAPRRAGGVIRLDGRAPIPRLGILGAPGCNYYVRTSLCTSAEGRPVCADVERQLALEPVERAVFAAAPSYDGLPYDREEVESSIARAVGVEP